MIVLALGKEFTITDKPQKPSWCRETLKEEKPHFHVIVPRTCVVPLRLSAPLSLARTCSCSSGSIPLRHVGEGSAFP